MPGSSFEPDVLEALQSVRVGDELLILTWLDRADRDVLMVHPRGDTSRPPEGVFTDALAAPARIRSGLHRGRGRRGRRGGGSRCANLEALDGTPVVDVKPVLSAEPPSADRRCRTGRLTACGSAYSPEEATAPG